MEMYNYDQQRMPVYNQPIEFLYARGIQPGVNPHPGIGNFVGGVRRTMQGINGMGMQGMGMPMGTVSGGPMQDPYMHQGTQQIMHVEKGKILINIYLEWFFFHIFNVKDYDTIIIITYIRSEYRKYMD